jgi:hypothetical protein
MAKKKPRWAELGNGNIAYVDSDGMIMARVTYNVLDGTFRYQDKDFIDAAAVMRHVEKEKFRNEDS